MEKKDNIKKIKKKDCFSLDKSKTINRFPKVHNGKRIVILFMIVVAKRKLAIIATVWGPSGAGLLSSTGLVRAVAWLIPFTTFLCVCINSLSRRAAQLSFVAAAVCSVAWVESLIYQILNPHAEKEPWICTARQFHRQKSPIVEL